MCIQLTNCEKNLSVYTIYLRALNTGFSCFLIYYCIKYNKLKFISLKSNFIHFDHISLFQYFTLLLLFQYFRLYFDHISLQYFTRACIACRLMYTAQPLYATTASYRPWSGYPVGQNKGLFSSGSCRWGETAFSLSSVCFLSSSEVLFRSIIFCTADETFSFCFL